jgi:hypothetical protein
MQKIDHSPFKKPFIRVEQKRASNPIIGMSAGKHTFEVELIASTRVVLTHKRIFIT